MPQNRRWSLQLSSFSSCLPLGQICSPGARQPLFGCAITCFTARNAAPGSRYQHPGSALHSKSYKCFNIFISCSLDRPGRASSAVLHGGPPRRRSSTQGMTWWTGSRCVQKFGHGGMAAGGWVQKSRDDLWTTRAPCVCVFQAQVQAAAVDGPYRCSVLELLVRPTWLRRCRGRGLRGGRGRGCTPACVMAGVWHTQPRWGLI